MLSYKICILATILTSSSTEGQTKHVSFEQCSSEKTEVYSPRRTTVPSPLPFHSKISISNTTGYTRERIEIEFVVNKNPSPPSPSRHFSNLGPRILSKGISSFPPEEDLNRRKRKKAESQLNPDNRISTAEQLSAAGHISSIVAITVSLPTFSPSRCFFDILPLDGQVIFSTQREKSDRDNWKEKTDATD